MNMLAGVICDTMFDASRRSKEESDRENMSVSLYAIYNNLDIDADQLISEKEMAAIMEDEDAVKLLMRMGVDVYALIDECPTIYGAMEGRNLSFTDFVDVVWQFRPSDAAMMKSLSIMRRSLAKVLEQIGDVDLRVKRVLRVSETHVRNSCFQMRQRSPY